MSDWSKSICRKCAKRDVSCPIDPVKPVLHCVVFVESKTKTEKTCGKDLKAQVIALM